MNLISLIIEAVSGALGGNIAGATMKENSLGTLGNSIAGIVGGGLGGVLLQSVLGGAADGTTTSGTGVGGAVSPVPPGGVARHVVDVSEAAVAKK